MIKSVLVMFALAVVAYPVYLHYLSYRRLKAENFALRKSWKAYMAVSKS